MSFLRLPFALLLLASAIVAVGEDKTPDDATLAVETLITEIDAYSPIPSPNGSKIAFVGTGSSSKGMGRSSLKSELLVMDANGKLLTPVLAKAFLSGWTSDGKALVCYRDWKCFLIGLDGIKLKESTLPETGRYARPERAVLLPRLNEMAWMRYGDNYTCVETMSGEVVRQDGEHQRPGDLLVPSPDGRYIAAIWTTTHFQNESLWVFDFETKARTKLGKAFLHPYRAWDWAKPAWSPWFPDGSKLVYVSDGKLIVSSPDGKSQDTVAEVKEPAALPAASPDGKRLAFVTFDKQPKETHYWGGTTIWVVDAKPGSIPRPVTKKAKETVYCLRWLNDKEIVLDRMGQAHFFVGSRIWKVTLPDEQGRK